MKEIRDIINKKFFVKELRTFGIRFSIALVILGSIFIWRKKNFAVYPFYISSIVIFATIFIPRLLSPIHKALLIFGRIVAIAVTNSTLVIMYYLIVTPVGFIMRIFGGDILNTRFKDNKETYWIPRETTNSVDKKSYKNQY